MKESDFKFSNLRVVDMPGAMEHSDKFDAVIGWEPGMRRIVKAGKGKVVITAKQFADMAGITYPFLLTTTPTYLKAHPDIVQKVVNAYAKADKYHHHPPRRRGRDLPGRGQAPRRQSERRRHPQHAVRRRSLQRRRFTAADWKDLPATRDYLLKIGQLKSKLDLDKIIDQSYGKKADAAAK